MAKRQDTGSDSAHENERPTSHNEDAVPEMTDNLRGRADEEDEGDEFDEDEDVESFDEDEDEGSV
jgi:hypothetical protein